MSRSITPSRFDNVVCNLCRSDRARVKYVSPGWEKGTLQSDSFRAATDQYGDYGRIVECRECGLVYTHPRLPAGPLLDAYGRTEDEEYRGEDAGRSINGHFSLNTIGQFTSKGSLLDVGCSTGYLLNAARLHFDTQGVEPSRWAAEFARTQLRLNVFQGSLEDARFPSASYDVVTMVDVIEHLDDPLASLKEIHRLTKPGGLLYIVTPNVSSLAARLMRSKWWGLRPAHIYYFSPRTLTRLLDAAGFETVLMHSYGRVFTLDYWLSRLRHYSSPVTRFLRWGIQRWDIGRKLVYLNTLDSIECCARKRSL